MQSIFRDDAMQWYIPSLSFQAGYSLTLMSKPYEYWFAPMVSLGEIRACAVIESTAHAQAVAAAVKGD